MTTPARSRNQRSARIDDPSPRTLLYPRDYEHVAAGLAVVPSLLTDWTTPSAPAGRQRDRDDAVDFDARITHPHLVDQGAEELLAPLRR